MDQSPEDLGLAPDLSRLPSEVRDLIRYGHRGQYPTHSEDTMAVREVMFRVGYAVDEIWMILTDPANGISDSFYSKDGEEQGEAYLERIISQAYDLTKRKEPSMT
jgi:hypothetical protein